MNTFFTVKRIVLFLGIVFIGVLGLIIADQMRYEKGDSEPIVIGNGVPDPLAELVREDLVSTTRKSSSDTTTIAPSKIAPKTSPAKATVPVNSSIDGVRNITR